MFKIEKLILFVLLQVIFYTAHTQVNFVASTIIQLNGDTIKGEINYQEWEYNPRKIQFRNKNTQSVKTYTCKDIKGFTINDKNEKYQTAIVDVDNDPVEGANLKRYESMNIEEMKPQLVRDTVFLLINAQGRLNFFSLFQYADSKPHYFIQKNNGKIEELVYRRAKVMNRDTNSIVTIQAYKNQLQTLTADCAFQKQGFDKLLYIKSDILEVVTKYNICSGQSSYINKERHGQRRILVLTGAALPLIKLSDYYNTNAKTAAGYISPTFGFAFEQSYNRLRNKLGVGVEVNVALCKADISTLYNLYSRLVQYKVNAVSFKINPYLRYAFTAGKIQPYVKLGLGITYLSKADVERFYTEPSFPIPIIVQPLNMPKRHFHYFTAFGVKYNNYFIESRFDASINFVDDGSDNAFTKQLALVCGYSWNFNKDVAKK